MQQIADWLEKLGMSEYTQVFAENRIDFSVLPALTDQDLKDIGVALGDRCKILRAIDRFNAAPEAAMIDGPGTSGLPRRDSANPPPADLPSVGLPKLPKPRETLLSERSSPQTQMITRFRDVDDVSAGTAKAAKGLRRTREAYEEEVAEEPAASSLSVRPESS